MSSLHRSTHSIDNPSTFWNRFQTKLAQSQTWVISLFFHSMLLILASSVYLFHSASEPNDFVAEGEGGLLAETELPPAPEQPADAVPTETLETHAPDLHSPSLDVLSTTAMTNKFKISSKVKVTVQSRASLTPSSSTAARGTAGSLSGLPGVMQGRTGNGRLKAQQQFKMKDATEAAVLRGLNWLRDHQNNDGSWGDSQRSAMTGFGLLCFLGHGESADSPNYGVTVARAVQWILDEGTKHQGRLSMEPTFTMTGSYSHAICSYALGEYFTMTKDERVIELLKQAIQFIVAGQNPGGAWCYSYDKSVEDLSVSGWQIQALKAAYLSQLNLPGVEGTLDKAMKYLDRIRGPRGGYGYRFPEDRYSLTGAGVLCRLFWKGERGDVRKGMEFVLETTEKGRPVKYQSPQADLYAWYYHTQAALMFGGAAWDKWNRWFQDEITNAQNPDGSWPPPGGNLPGPQRAPSMTGQVYRTTLCILMLEVYYRYMPSHSAL